LSRTAIVLPDLRDSWTRASRVAYFGRILKHAVSQ
jgi:hypothetical protein